MDRRRLWIDIETYSAVDLRNATPYRYAEDPGFQILMAAWSRDGKKVNVAIGEKAVHEIPGLWDDDVTKVAHNAQFERICFSRLAGLPVGTYLPAETYHDTQAIAGVRGYPQSLMKLAVALGADEKDEAGTRLINLFCKPNRKGDRNRPEDYPTEWLDFVFYCSQDVHALIDVDRLLGTWPTESERLVYLADQAINDTGIRLDTDLAQQAVLAAEANRQEQETEVRALTGVNNPGSNLQMMEWCRSVGLKNQDLQKATVEKLLAGNNLNDDVRRVLELRQELALVASKKFSAALNSVSTDGRLRGSFRYFGAHTGRWTGRGTQLQNLPRAQLASEDDTNAAILDLDLGLGASAFTLKALVRSMFQGPFVVVDYAAIEARVLAWMANETWALDAFRAGRDIYVETADRMGVPTRAQGKVAVLALGYAGSTGSLRVMGAKGTDQQLQQLVSQWRRANARIVRLWSVMEEAFRTGGKVGDHMRVERDGADRLLVLPSGRAIAYRRCAWNGGPSFQDVRGVRVRTYGGRLTENATQAIARDIMGEAIVRLVDAGYRVVGHVHDEVITEGTDLAGVTSLMLEPPRWATGLPIDGEGFVTERYRKG